ncbi:beta-galactosidase [Paenibacillus chungangensis]|uniref:Beta-galactosidase n=1 Tax=Paenibacillus chungangensis TaxID=696535 RepID=A0ABW3HTQ8_9BACL
MKACGISIVATYIFWNHHEEIEGEHEWSGSRNVRQFLNLCARHQMYAFLRLGPYCHGEARIGGFPDWVVSKCRIRTNDPLYMTYVQRHYRQIFGQVEGMLFKDGGPVIGVQIENEYLGGQEHMAALKKMAIDAGFDVPYYSATAGGGQFDSIPEGELLSMFGGYPEAPWSQHTEPMPPNTNFFFTPIRDDSNVGSDLIKHDLDKRGKNPPEIERYPYFMCELGSGNQVTHHRRPIISSDDIASMALVKLGSGCNWPGYYMFHGGTNPIGHLSTLHESKATGYPNNYPVLSYDFQSPIGEYGQMRDGYHELKLIHFFLQDFGELLAPMCLHLPKRQPKDLMDTDTLKCAVRSDGSSGFLFINNYVRLQENKSIEKVQFEVALANGDSIRFPNDAITIPADERAIFPFQLMLEEQVILRYATAQLVAKLDGYDATYVFFAVDGIPVQMAFDITTVKRIALEGKGNVSQNGQIILVSELEAGPDCIVRLELASGRSIRLLILTKAQALRCWKAEMWGEDRLFMSEADILVDGNRAQMLQRSPVQWEVSIYPEPLISPMIGEILTTVKPKGAFVSYSQIVRQDKLNVAVQALANGIADYDGKKYEVRQWRIKVNADCDCMDAYTDVNNIFLRIEYEGDMAVLRTLEQELLADHFYNGLPWEIGLKQCITNLNGGEWLLQIMPMMKQQQIYLERVPSFEEDTVAELLSVKAEVEYTKTIE